MSTDLATLTGAYVVNALPDDERTEFELHLTSCADCRQEVQELREAAARLGAAEHTTTPEELKQRVLAEIAQTRQDPPPPVAARTGRAGRRRTRPHWGTRLSVAAAAIGVALAAAFGVVAVRAQQELDATRDRMIAAGTRGAEISAMLQAPDARVINASGPEGMRATTVLSEQHGKAMFMTTGMTPAPNDRVYQLWFIDPAGEATSAGLLNTTGTDRTDPLIAAMPPTTAQLGITVEPPGGSKAPTTTPILTLPTT